MNHRQILAPVYILDDLLNVYYQVIELLSLYSSAFYPPLKLRSSFNKAFSIKKGSKTYSDIEEIATPDSSAPSSPKMPHEVEESGENQSSSALSTSV